MSLRKSKYLGDEFPSVAPSTRRGLIPPLCPSEAPAAAAAARTVSGRSCIEEWGRSNGSNIRPAHRWDCIP